MTNNLRIATCQFPVSHNITENVGFIQRFIKKAAAADAHAVHFPETALPGYGRRDFTSDHVNNWQELGEQTQKIVEAAERFGLWVILGSCRKIANKEKPANCVHVISDAGKIVGTYDKQKLTASESDFYTPGRRFLDVTIRGIKCGFLICYELCFPALFETYRKRGVQLIFHSCYNVSRKPRSLFEELTLAQFRTRAADHQMWISASNSSARYTFSTACIARPDGSIRRLRKHTNGILLHDFPDTKLGWTYDNQS